MHGPRISAAPENFWKGVVCPAECLLQTETMCATHFGSSTTATFLVNKYALIYFPSAKLGAPTQLCKGQKHSVSRVAHECKGNLPSSLKLPTQGMHKCNALTATPLVGATHSSTTHYSGTLHSAVANSQRVEHGIANTAVAQQADHVCFVSAGLQPYC